MLATPRIKKVKTNIKNALPVYIFIQNNKE